MVFGPESTRKLVYLVLLLFVFTLTACGAGYRTSVINGVEKVYRVDEQGNKTLIYEVSKDGKTTVYDENDRMYKNHLAKQQLVEKVKKADAERIALIKKARKRKAKDPIFVALHTTELDSKLKKAEKPKGAVFKQIKKEFKSDRIIKLVSMKQLKRNEIAQIGKVLAGSSPRKAPPADVDVVSRGYVKEVYGVNKKTGKPGKMVAVVFEATIKSNYLPAQYKVKETGSILRNVEVTKKFSRKIKDIIKRKIGPTIPADRSI